MDVKKEFVAKVGGYYFEIGVWKIKKDEKSSFLFLLFLLRVI